MNTVSIKASNPDLIRLARLVNDRLLELIILPTEKCNFRCTYCYEDFAIGKMKRETIDAVKALIKKRARELDVLEISWFGGEPLLAKDVVLEISNFAAKCASENTNLSYRGSMTTNGFNLDLATFSDLAKAGVLTYQISLDGPPEIHNRTRVLSGGEGSFDRIWNNLIAIKTTDIPAEILLRVHYDRETVTQLDPLLDEIKKNLLPSARFSVLFHEIQRLGGPKDDQIKVVTTQERRKALEYLNARLYGTEVSPPADEPYVCYAARPNSLLIRADGRIGKCTVALNDPRNVIGKLRSDGTLDLNQKRIHPWLRGLVTLDERILECPLNGMLSE